MEAPIVDDGQGCLATSPLPESSAASPRFPESVADY